MLFTTAVQRIVCDGLLHISVIINPNDDSIIHITCVGGSVKGGGAVEDESSLRSWRQERGHLSFRSSVLALLVLHADVN